MVGWQNYFWARNKLMDVALKQRLVGASVLVIFSVTFIPMLLDGPPSSRVESPIAIPQPPDKRFETRLLPVGGNTDASSNERSPDQSAASEAPQPQPRQQRPAVTVPPPATVAASPNGVSADSNQSTEPPQPSSAPAPDQSDQVVNQAPPAQPGGRWVLQLGSFGNAANAARLVERLKQGDWNAYQERVEVGSNALYRVRVRGWPVKTAALEAGERLLQQYSDLELSVREAPADIAAAPIGNAMQGWMVQLGSFGSEANAIALRDKLRAGGFAAHVSDAGSSATARYRVRVGPELDEISAKRTRDKIRSQLSLNGMVIDHP